MKQRVGSESRLGRCGRIARVVAYRLRRRFERDLSVAFARFARRRALLWQSFYVAQYRYLVLQARYGSITAAMALLLLIVGSAYWVPALQGKLEPYFATEAQLALLRSLLLTLGGAMVASAAIVTSLVLFAMQVNIERMPHGLFRRLSADRRLLCAFAATFLLAVGVAILSLVAGQQRIGLTVVAAFWGTALIIALFVYGYRRALILVNPIQQLQFVVRETQRELRAWARHATRAVLLLSNGDKSRPTQNDPHAPQQDFKRTEYFQANPGWTRGALRGVQYAMPNKVTMRSARPR